MTAKCGGATSKPHHEQAGKCKSGRANRGLKPRKLTAEDLDPARFLDDEDDDNVAAESASALPSVESLPGNKEPVTEDFAPATDDATEDCGEGGPSKLEQIKEEMLGLPPGDLRKKELHTAYKAEKAKQSLSSSEHSSPAAGLSDDAVFSGGPIDSAPNGGEADAGGALALDDGTDDDFPGEDDFGDDASTPYSKQSAPEKFESPQATISAQARGELLAMLSEEQQYEVRLPRWMGELDDCLSLTARMVLAQLVYWTDPVRGHAPQIGRGIFGHWTAKSAGELAEETTLTKDEVNKALSRLKKLGYVDWKTKKFANKNSRHIWIRWESVLAAYEKSQASGQ